MYKVIFEVPSFDHAKMLAQWYEGHGEQSVDDWFMEHGLRAPFTDSNKGFYKIDDVNKVVIVYCK